MKWKRGELEGAKEINKNQGRHDNETKKTRGGGMHKKKKKKKANQLVKELITEKQCKSTTLQDKALKCLTEEPEIVNRWTEYYSELYNYKTYNDCPQVADEETLRIQREEVETF